MTLLSEVKLSSAPALEPVSLTDAKSYMKVDYTDDDTMIEDVLIPAAPADGGEKYEQVTDNPNLESILQRIYAEGHAALFTHPVSHYGQTYRPEHHHHLDREH